jgi:hypothetical protein
MTDEHRLTFTLFRVPGLEATALDSIMERLSVSKRSHEYVRRIMVQGLVLTKILKKVDRTISEIQHAVTADCSGECPNEFKFRLNVELNSSQPVKTPEEEIWVAASKITKRDERKDYLRDLFLHGYWFESLPGRDENIINQLFAKENQAESVTVIELPTPPVINSAKSKLGGLMPL